MTTTKRCGLYLTGLTAIIFCATTANSSDGQLTFETSSWDESPVCCFQTTPKTLFRWSSDPFSTTDADNVTDYEEWAKSRIFFGSP